MEADGVNTAAQHLSQATGAPMLSRLLEAGPTHFSAQFGFTVGPNSACSSAVSAETAAVNSAASAYPELDVMEPSIPVSEGKKESELHEEDITMCYMGDELDLKTVGEIIAIIEDKADEATEALDAAAVENALSLCEENSQSLSVVWTSAAFQVQQDLSRPKNLADNTGGFRPQGETSALPFTSSSSSCNSRSSENCYTEAGPQPEAGTGSEQMLHQKNLVSLDIAVKCENEQWSQQRLDADSVLEDSPLTERHLQEMRPEDRRQDVSGTKRVNGDVNRPELCGEDEAAEGFLSEDREAEPAASESEDGYSLTASSALQLQAVADSAPSSPASSHFSVCNEDLEALQAQKIWKKAIMLVWRAAANHRYANVFLQPVTDEIAPGYHSIVQRPIDLATIKKNIETSLIRTTAEFQRDILLMFQNAIMYNSLDHNVYHMALEMQQDVLEQIQQFLATQLIMETSESGISTKSLRGRESTHKQDPTDKEIVSMSSPAFLLSLFDRGTRGRRCAIDIDLKMKK